MILLLATGKGILHLLYPSVEPAVMSACETYLWIVTLSFPANALYNAGTAIHRAMGKTSVTMRVSMAMNLVNVVGNAIGIFVLHAGAAGVQRIHHGSGVHAAGTRKGRGSDDR